MVNLGVYCFYFLVLEAEPEMDSGTMVYWGDAIQEEALREEIFQAREGRRTEQRCVWVKFSLGQM